MGELTKTNVEASGETRSNEGRRYGLSKSKITAFEQCTRKLWLSRHRPELALVDDGAEARFTTGHQVGDLACSLLPTGVMVEAEPDLAAAVARTRELIDNGWSEPIFEATFEHDGVLVRVDVLSPTSGGWAMAEVKSSAGVKAYHLGDLATQVWVASKCHRLAFVTSTATFVSSRKETTGGCFVMRSAWGNSPSASLIARWSWPTRDPCLPVMSR